MLLNNAESIKKKDMTFQLTYKKRNLASTHPSNHSS